MTTKDRHLFLYWVLGFVLLGNLFVIYRFVGLNWAEDVLSFTGREWVVLFAQASFIGAVGGMCFGAVDLVVRRHPRFRPVGFAPLVLLKSAAFAASAFVALFLGFFLAALANGYPVDQALARALRFHTSAYALVIMLYLVVNATLLNFVEQVSEKFGAGQLLRIFLGRYHHPVEEARVFVFLDLRSSTTYAEQLGHIQYSRLVQDVFREITADVETFQAEIYQYVGDEIVLTWEMSERPDACRNAIRLCYAFRDRLREQAEAYRERYGLVPDFKVGVSAGRVTAAEVGVRKKEIAYHGDVLNTGSRIQEQCTRHGRFLLCSAAVADGLRGVDGFRVDAVGEVALKGKRSPVPLFSVEPDVT